MLDKDTSALSLSLDEKNKLKEDNRVNDERKETEIEEDIVGQDVE